MSKILCVFLLVFVAASVSARIVDSYSFLKDNADYAALTYAVRHEGDLNTSMSLFNKIQKDNLDTYSEEMNTVLKVKASTILARFLVKEVKPEMKTEAEMILAEARRKIASLKKDSFFRLTLDADIDSICFLADRTDLSKGINSSQNINKAFKKYPEEITSILLKANSLLFAPGFAGGDIGKACNMFLSLMRDHSSDMSNWDLASLYSGIGIACYKLKDYPNAKAYLSNAKSMYPVDSEIDSYLEKQERS